MVIHIECLSIGLDDELVLGGLAPVTSSDSMDLENVKTIIRSMLSNPTNKNCRGIVL